MRLFLPIWMIAAVAAAGIIETTRTGQIGVLGILCAIELLTLGIALSLWRSQVPVMLRADLANWLDATAALTGETVPQIVDRAVSSYRAGLSDDEPR